MSNNNIRAHLKHLRSQLTTEQGTPVAPNYDELEVGEIAMNYSEGNETLYIRNNNNGVASFGSSEKIENEINEVRNTITDNELVVSAALNDLNERIDEEKSTRETADIEISQRLANEITNREGADNTLRNDLGSQINRLSSQIPTPDGRTIIADNDGKISVNTHEGFLIDENGINVALGSSLTTENGEIDVKPGDDTIIVDVNGVSVNVNDEGGIGYDSNGLYVRTGDGLTVDTDRVKVNTPSNSGLTVDSNGVSVKASNGLTVDSNGLYLKTASTSEIGGVAIHDVHKTLIYEYRPIIGYTDDDVVVISVEEYNALPQEEKDSYWEVYGEWGEITEEQYNELPEEDKRNPAKVSITTDELTFNDGDGNFGVNINDADNKAYVNVPIAGENASKYGLVKVGVTDVVHGLNGIKIDRNNGRLAVDYDNNYLSLNNGGVSLTLKSSVVAQLKTYYDVILYMKVLSVDVSTGDITFDNSTLNFVTYNPNDYTVSQIIAGLVNGTITTKVIVDFSAVNSNMVAKFPKIWETTMNYTGMGDIFGIYNTIFPFLDNSLTPSTSPYIKLENVGMDAQGRFQASTKVLMNHTGWTV